MSLNIRFMELTKFNLVAFIILFFSLNNLLAKQDIKTKNKSRVKKSSVSQDSNLKALDSQPINSLAGFKVLDETVATAYTPEGNILVLKSDIRPSLDGKPRTLKDILFEELAVKDAKKLHIEVTDEDVEKYLLSLQKQTGYSAMQIENSLRELGYKKREEWIEALKKTQMLQDVVSYRVRSSSQVLVTQEAIQEYYDKNPVILEESYKISQAYLEFNKEKSYDENVLAVEKLIADGDIQYAVSWDEPIEFKISELSQEQQFVKDMLMDQISIFKKTPEGIYLVRLVSKSAESIKPLEERKEEIESYLKTKVYQDKMADYEKTLFDAVKIRYHNIDFQDPQLSK